jgi:hypothetical protein
LRLWKRRFRSPRPAIAGTSRPLVTLCLSP